MVNMTRRKMLNRAAIGAGGLAAAAAIVPARDLVQSGNDAGHGVFEYDQPSTTFGRFGDGRVTAVARGLDGPPSPAITMAHSYAGVREHCIAEFAQELIGQ